MSFYRAFFFPVPVSYHYVPVLCGCESLLHWIPLCQSHMLVNRILALFAAGMVIPRLPRSDISWATAMVGAIIMPHNIYLHSALVLSRSNPCSHLLFLISCILFSGCQFGQREEEGRTDVHAYLTDCRQWLTLREHFNYRTWTSLLRSRPPLNCTAVDLGFYAHPICKSSYNSHPVAFVVLQPLKVSSFSWESHTSNNLSRNPLGCRKINGNIIGRKKEAANYFYIESAIALVLSWLINTFVLSVFAKGFFGTAKEDVGLENAGNYLGDTFGAGMKYIWAIGLLAAGHFPSTFLPLQEYATFMLSHTFLPKNILLSSIE